MTPGPANSKTEDDDGVGVVVVDPPEKEHVAVKIEEEEEEEIEVQASSHAKDKSKRKMDGGSSGRGGGGTSDDDNYDNDFLHRVVEDAGRWAYGTVLVEVWVLNPQKTHLYRPDDGWWIDPYFYDRNLNTSCGLCRLTDKTRDDYMDAIPLPPGVGLPGALWCEVQRGNIANNKSSMNRRTSATAPEATNRRASRITSSTRSSGRRNNNQQDDNTFGDVANNTTQQQGVVKWRQIKLLANDPDQPYNPRLQFLANECKLEWAAGVPFSMGGKQGLVVYMARENITFNKLSSCVNEEYLIHATLLIGSAISLRDYRHEQVHVRKNELDETCIRVRNKLLALTRLGISLDTLIKEPVQPKTNDDGGSSNKKTAAMVGTKIEPDNSWILITLRKCLGGNVPPPPRFTWEQTIWTLFSSFITLLILTRIHVRLVEEFGPTHGIILGYVFCMHMYNYCGC